MTGLRSKLFCAVTLVFICLIAATYTLFDQYILEQLGEVERQKTVTNVTRVVESIHAAENDLAKRAADWGFWDESYSFVNGTNENYPEVNLGFDALSPFEISHVLFIKLDGETPLYGVQYNYEDESRDTITSDTIETFLTSTGISSHLTKAKQHQTRSGIVQYQARLFLYAVSAITDSERVQPQSGFLIFTREITTSLEQEIAQRTKLDIEFLEPKLVSDATLLFQPRVTNTSPSEVRGEVSLFDILGQPALTLRISMGRDIYHQGLRARNNLMTLLVAFILIANFVVLLLFERIVIQPIERVGKTVDHISQTKDMSERLLIRGRDQVASLAMRFNHLLTVIEETYHELDAAKASAVRANAAKSSFLAKVSHEIRTPLHSIIGMLRIVQRDEVDAGRRSYIELVRTSAHTLLTIINDLLDFSKAESGMLHVVLKESSVRSILDGAAKAVAAKVYETGSVELIIDCDPRTPELIFTDNHRLQQVLINLLGNAVKFTARGALTLTTEVDINSDRLSFHVTDTGEGIPPQMLGAIFDPFVQVDQNQKRAASGTGLGLTITKQLVETLGGTISATSVVGSGSTFSITFPLSTLKPRGQLFNITSLPKECHIFSRSPEIAEALNRFLHANGVNTHQHNDPMMLNVERDSLVIVDDSMLSTGGIHRVISLPDEARARLVIMINPLNLQLWQHLESHGCSGLVWKPVAIGSLFWSYPQREEAPVAMVPSAPLEQRQLSVLIADDIPTNTIILSELLREAGHTVTMVENGKELCDRLGLDGHENGEEHFDIVFTDLQMPILDGRGAIKRVRASSGHYSHVPIVVVTADGYEESHRTLIEEGANAVMVKPFNEDKLNALLINLTRGGGRDVTEHT